MEKFKIWITLAGAVKQLMKMEELFNNLTHLLRTSGLVKVKSSKIFFKRV